MRDDLRDAVFIHIPKTAGTTIRTVLGFPEYRSMETLRKGFKQMGHVSFGHMLYRGLVQSGEVGSAFHARAFKFTFVRNPYTRAVSLYQYYLKTNKIGPRSFLTFLRQLDVQALHLPGLYNQRGWSQCNPQARWTEGVRLDFVGRFERLEEHLGAVCDLLGVDAPGRVPRLNQTEDRPLSEFYGGDPEAQELVADLYRVDFEAFGYDPDQVPGTEDP